MLRLVYVTQYHVDADFHGWFYSPPGVYKTWKEQFVPSLGCRLARARTSWKAEYKFFVLCAGDLLGSPELSWAPPDSPGLS